MIVQDIMEKNIIVTSIDLSINDASNLMKKERIRHLPVVNDDMEIIGLVSDRDIKSASPSTLGCEGDECLDLPVEKIMVTDIYTAFLYDFVEDAANIMIENQISCLPVVEDDKLVGIITEEDLLRTLVMLTGANTPSSRIDVEVPNESGMLFSIASIIKDYQYNVHSALIYPSNDSEKKVLVFRIQAMDIRRLVEAIREAGYKVLWPQDLDLEMKL